MLVFICIWAFFLYNGSSMDCEMTDPRNKDTPKMLKQIDRWVPVDCGGCLVES